MLKNKVLFGNGRDRPQPSKFYFGEIKGDSEEDIEDLDEEQIKQIFKDQGMMRKEKSEIRDQKMYVGVECKASFYVFTKTNWIRILGYKII